MPYSSALYCTNLVPSLQQRRDQRARKFFKSILAPDSCVHSLLPAPCDKNLIARLRAARTFPALASRTKRYQSFINFGLYYTISNPLIHRHIGAHCVFMRIMYIVFCILYGLFAC